MTFFQRGCSPLPEVVLSDNNQSESRRSSTWPELSLVPAEQPYADVFDWLEGENNNTAAG